MSLFKQLLACGVVSMGLSWHVALAAESEKAPAAQVSPQTRQVIKVSAQVGPEKDDTFAVLLDVNDVPDAKDWGLTAANYAIKWYPVLVKRLASDGFKPVREVTIVFRTMKDIAFSNGSTITVSGDWVKAHPEDLGMIAHELTHVIQQYPDGAPGWLVEGLTDYIRYYVVEAGSEQAGFDPDSSSYTSGYQPAAGMLNWLETTRGPGIISRLNQIMREGKYTPAAFKEITGGDPDELWEQFKKSLKAKK